MSAPVASGSASLPLSIPLNRGDNALTAPITPGKRIQAVDRTKVDPKIVQAAEGMEGMFLDYLMKVMRSTVPKSEMSMESPATDIYRSMLDSEIAQKAARTQGVGLADQIIAYLQPESYHQPKGSYSPATSQRKAPSDDRTGGTHEGQPIRK